MNKNIFFISLALGLGLVCGCNKELQSPSESAFEKIGSNSYLLKEFSADLRGESTKTTGFTTPSDLEDIPVMWESSDKIAIFNITSKTAYLYDLVATANGDMTATFKPSTLAAPSGYTAGAAVISTGDDVRAVYPPAAFELDPGTGEVRVSLYKDLNASQQSAFGLSGYDKFSFAANDIKISTSGIFVPKDPANLVNVKFTQLASYCRIKMNFSSDNTLKTQTAVSFDLSTVNGTTPICGTASVNLSGAVPALLIATGGAVSIPKYTFAGSQSLGSEISRDVVLFPGNPSGNMFQIRLVASDNTVTLNAERHLEAGHYYYLDASGFTSRSTSAARENTYIVQGTPLVYYGEANCILIAAGDNSEQTMDVTPYMTDDVLFAYNKTASSEPSIADAKVIWCEFGLSISTCKVAANTLGVTRSSGNGNALVGIFDSAGDLLWSFHVWCPTADPTSCISYTTNQGSHVYQVMSLPLGATDNSLDQLSSYGLYYQWGRKDPMGKPNGVTSNTLESVTFTPTDTDLAKVYTNASLATNGSDFFSGQQKDNEYIGTDAISAKDKALKSIDYARKHPCTFITGNDWSAEDDDTRQKMTDMLWGNGQGFNYPDPNDIHKSVYDPCPKGYRVAPCDTWMNSRGSFSSNHWHFNIYNDNYSASGERYSPHGSLDYVGIGGSYWSSSPGAHASASGLMFDSRSVYPTYSYYNCRSYGYAVRCVQGL